MDGLPQAPGSSKIFEFQVYQVSEGIIGDRIDWNRINQRLVVYSFLRNYLTFSLLVVYKIQIVQIGDVLIDTVGDKNIPHAVVVHVKDQRAPTPVSGFHVGESSHLAEGAVPIVDVEHVA